MKKTLSRAQVCMLVLQTMVNEFVLHLGLILDLPNKNLEVIDVSDVLSW